MIASSLWADRVANYVRDVVVPCAFAGPWWKVRLRGAVPLGSAKHAGVNAAIASSARADRVANYVRDAAVPCVFAWPWWKVRLRGAVPLGSAKHAGVNSVCRW